MERFDLSTINMNLISPDLRPVIREPDLDNIDSCENLINMSCRAGKKCPRDELFIKELNELLFTDDIKTEAFNIYKNMTLSIKRKKNRKGLKFFCIYNSFRNLGRIRDANQIAKIIGLDQSDLNKAMKTFSYTRTGYRMKEVDITPLDFISEYYAYTELRKDEVPRVIGFAEEILSKDGFSNEFPQLVAASIIVYYMQKIHNIIPPERFFIHVNRTENMIQKIVQKIGTILNS